MINKDKLNEVLNNNRETVSVDIGEYGNVEVRKFIDEPTQEAVALHISRNVFNTTTGQYTPLRKEALMTVMFVNAFIVAGDDLLVAVDGDDIDIYATHDIVANRLRLIDKSIEVVPDIRMILNRISSAVDAQVEFMMSHWNAMSVGGAFSATEETIETLNNVLVSAKEFIVTLNVQIAQNGGRLSKLMTKKNIDMFLNGLSEKLENIATKYVNENVVPFSK